MQVSVTFRHMEPTGALKEFANEKVQRINKLFHKPAEAHVVLSLEKYMHKADVTVSANGLMMRGEEKSEDMYQSIDRAIEKIERQLKRYQGKVRNHKAREDGKFKVRLNVLEPDGPVAEANAEVPVESAPAPKVVRTREFVAKPMTVDEAIMQMDLLHNDFLVFQNSATHEINVIYRRKDGNLGLIEAAMHQ
ncbi:MAG: ribosome-associated translation inhibitor RaiA [Myxococcota bacterium]